MGEAKQVWLAKPPPALLPQPRRDTGSAPAAPAPTELPRVDREVVAVRELIAVEARRQVLVGDHLGRRPPPLSRLVAIDIRNPSKYNWKEIVPQSKDTLRGVSLVNDMFVASYLHDAQTNVRIFGMDGAHVRDVKLPGIGSAGGFGGKKTDTETFYSFTGFTSPGAVYRYDLTTGTSTLFRKPKVDFDATQYETKQHERRHATAEVERARLLGNLGE